MSVTITGKIIQALPPVEGVSSRTGKNWVKQEYVLETVERYPKRCCFTVFGQDKIDALQITVGQTLEVTMDIDAHEYNGRWYNSLTGWQVKVIDAAMAQAAQDNVKPAGAVYPDQTPQQPTPQQPAPAKTKKQDDKEDDLPF